MDKKSLADKIERDFGPKLGGSSVTQERHEREQAAILQRAIDLMEREGGDDGQCEVVDDVIQLPDGTTLQRTAIVIPVLHIDENVYDAAMRGTEQYVYSVVDVRQYFVIGRHDVLQEDGTAIELGASLGVATVVEVTLDDDEAVESVTLEETNPNHPVFYSGDAETDERHAIHGKPLDVPFLLHASDFDDARSRRMSPEFWENLQCALDQIEDALNDLDRDRGLLDNQDPDF